MDGIKAIGEAASAAEAAGWRTTISHPAKSVEMARQVGLVLAAGIDSLYLAVDLTWYSDRFLTYLEKIKIKAAEFNVSLPGTLDDWQFNVEPHGLRGYSWTLSSAEYFVKFGAWQKPGARPSALIEIRSEALWLHGAAECVDRILRLLNCAGAKIEIAKVSRVDPCVDMLLPECIWHAELRRHRICRARSVTLHEDGDRLTGFEFGKGDLRARFYDKDLEIRVKSKKEWMRDIWNLHEVPEGAYVVRIEFQLRREVLRQLCVNTVWDLINHPRNLWNYCTHSWLRFVNDPKLHPDQQHTMAWWKILQDGFHGSQDAHPLIRAKIVQMNQTQLAQQLFGQFTSLIALKSEEMEPDVKLDEQLSILPESAKLIGMDDKQLSQRVKRKLSKFIHDVEKFKAADKERERLGLPVQVKKSA